MWALPASSQAQQTIVKSPPDTTAQGIPGVVADGTRVQLIRDLFQSTEGPIAMPDGSLLFTEQDAGDGALVKIDKDGDISTYLEKTNRTIGLAYDPKGRLIGAQSRIPRVGVLAPATTTLASEYGGQPLVFPNDLVVDKKGGIYFADQVNSRFRPPPPGRKPLIFYIRPDGQLVAVSKEVTNPNGVMLSPDETILHATNGPVIVAFDVQPDGALRNFRNFATLVGLPRNEAGVVTGGADGVAIDSAGRFYAATGAGVQVFSPQGQHLGTIPTPMPPQAIAFAGPDKKTLYVVGRGAVWKIAMIAQGYLGRAK
ncbi:MAG: SMP-30/gluconolactonase/LRE family protein [Acidobacteria bacterium]|nr:SMP-30/gluconolactonase/LRE family protein [Acidobacteriota bacterium]